MRRNFGSIAALFVGASLVWSCSGEVSSGNPTDSSPASNGSKGGASGAAGAPAGGAAGHGGSAGAAKPVSGAAGQPTGGTAVPPATGAAGQAGGGTAVPPATGAAGQAGGGTAVPPATGAAGQAGSGTAVPPATGAAGQAGSGTAVPPATGAAGQAGSGTAVPPPTGAAGSGSTTPSTGGAAGTTTPTATSAAATIVPLYTDPSDSSWSAVIAAKMEHPKVGVIAIVNPNNGPGSAASSGYTSGIARLTSAGIKVIGYVATGYATKTAATVEADIDRWKAFYPGQITGIFFDEQSNKAGDVAHYRELSQYAKSQGLSFTVGNPGTDTAEGYIGALDTMLIYESSGLPSASQMGGWHSKYPTSNFGIIPYAVNMDATFVHNARQYVQYIYLQSDNLPNPWDSLPSYFASLLAALE
jgi:hypothetical protein